MEREVEELRRKVEELEREIAVLRRMLDEGEKRLRRVVRGALEEDREARGR